MGLPWPTKFGPATVGRQLAGFGQSRGVSKQILDRRRRVTVTLVRRAEDVERLLPPSGQIFTVALMDTHHVADHGQGIGAGQLRDDIEYL
jgi:PII-like signaling protein